MSIVLDPTKTLRQYPPSTELETKKILVSASDRNKRRHHNGPETDENRQPFLKHCLKNWSKSEVCPLEDPDIHWSATELRESNSQEQKYPNNQFSSSNEDTDEDFFLDQANFHKKPVTIGEMTSNFPLFTEHKIFILSDRIQSQTEDIDSYQFFSFSLDYVE